MPSVLAILDGPRPCALSWRTCVASMDAGRPLYTKGEGIEGDDGRQDDHHQEYEQAGHPGAARDRLLEPVLSALQKLF